MIAWARGQRLEVRLQRLLLTSISFLACSIFSFGSLLLYAVRIFRLCLEPLTLFPCANWFPLQTGVRGQFGGFVGCFPGEVGVGAAEVSVGRGLTVNRTTEVERIYYLARLELE